MGPITNQEETTDNDLRPRIIWKEFGLNVMLSIRRKTTLEAAHTAPPLWEKGSVRFHFDENIERTAQYQRWKSTKGNVNSSHCLLITILELR